MTKSTVLICTSLLTAQLAEAPSLLLRAPSAAGLAASYKKKKKKKPTIYVYLKQTRGLALKRLLALIIYFKCIF